jgi:hypothetical protein
MVSSRSVPVKLARPYLKNKIQTTGWDVTQVVEHLSSMCKTMSSTPNVTHTHTHYCPLRSMNPIRMA